MQQKSSLVGGGRRETSVIDSPRIGPCYSSKLQLAGEIAYSEKVVCDFAACFKGESSNLNRGREDMFAYLHHCLEETRRSLWKLDSVEEQLR